MRPPFVHASLATAALRSETRRFISSLAGRISNVVILILTAGCFDISEMAWFRSRASSSRMPPSDSLVSTYGLSVTWNVFLATLRSRTALLDQFGLHVAELSIII